MATKTITKSSSKNKNNLSNIKLDTIYNLCEINDDDPILTTINNRIINFNNDIEDALNDKYIDDLVQDIVNINNKFNMTLKLNPLLLSIKDTCLKLKSIGDNEELSIQQKNCIIHSVKNLVIIYKNLAHLTQ